MLFPYINFNNLGCEVWMTEVAGNMCPAPPVAEEGELSARPHAEAPGGGAPDAGPTCTAATLI